MKDKIFDEISPELLDIIRLVDEKEYSEATQMIDDYISEVKETEQKNITVMIFLQVLALAGYKDTASILLKALLKNFKAFSKARYLCRKTIKSL